MMKTSVRDVSTPTVCIGPHYALTEQPRPLMHLQDAPERSEFKMNSATVEVAVMRVRKYLEVLLMSCNLTPRKRTSLGTDASTSYKRGTGPG